MACACGVLLAGCTVAPLYRSARTLEPGENEVGAGFAAARGSYSELAFYNGAANVKRPEAHKGFGTVDAVAARGLLDGVEAHGRLAFAETWMPYAEIGATWRFLQRGPWHVAVQPAAGARPDIGAVPHLKQAVLPLVASWEATPHWTVNAGGHAGWRWTGLGAQNPQDNLFEDKALQGVSGLTVGAAAGVDWHDDMVRVGAMLGWTRLTGHVAAPANLDYPLDVLQLTVTSGYLWGKEARHLEQTDEQLQQLIRKQP